MAVASFSNLNPVAIPGVGTSGTGSPYPSLIGVGGLQGGVTRVGVTLKGLSHTYPDDVDVLLVAPDGTTRSLVMSDAGTNLDVTAVNLAFDDNFPDALPDSAQILSGSYKPSDYGATADAFPAPAPAGPYAADFKTFRGVNPNGTWRLYINDDAGADSGNLAQGWELRLFHGANPVFGDDGDNLIKLKKSINTYAGGPGADTYRLGKKATRSTYLRKLDHITDFDTVNDRIDYGFKGPRPFGKDFGSLSSLNARALKKKFKPNKLKKKAWGTFTVGSGGPESERTFLILNDLKAGFQLKRDFLVEITGYFGSNALTNLNVI
ncbi:Proprotein convertase P-domain [Cyanobium sp. PCC 7001]|uniref:bluetail domain-containing putative surface protein n=1 Tax=Cyanobium sp. PCC 7001 TaxID=180281 RepID=UPI0001804EE7|nr:bluetail domain-containing putative surface protein [Cyanobium sp. PCC 7001]EDY38881.1 Proprotein convertase P-domain [Cyanobium sp. PCC 7001]